MGVVPASAGIRDRRDDGMVGRGLLATYGPGGRLQIAALRSRANGATEPRYCYVTLGSTSYRGRAHGPPVLDPLPAGRTCRATLCAMCPPGARGEAQLVRSGHGFTGMAAHHAPSGASRRASSTRARVGCSTLRAVPAAQIYPASRAAARTGPLSSILHARGGQPLLAATPHGGELCRARAGVARLTFRHCLVGLASSADGRIRLVAENA